MKLYVDGQLAGEGKAPGLITKDPAQPLEVGLDGQTAVGEYNTQMPFTGLIDEVRLYFLAANAEQIAARFGDGTEISDEAVLAVSFDDGTARDYSIKRNNGTVEGAQLVKGKFGKALQFSPRKKGGGNAAQKPGDSLVQPKWKKDIPIYVRAMVLAGQTLFIAGPPDIIDEEETFEQLTKGDPRVQKLLADQDAVLNGDDGLLLSINTATGKVENKIKLGTLPAWDGMAGANGQLYLSTLDGTVMCFGKK